MKNDMKRNIKGHGTIEIKCQVSALQFGQEWQSAMNDISCLKSLVNAEEFGKFGSRPKFDMYSQFGWTKQGGTKLDGTCTTDKSALEDIIPGEGLLKRYGQIHEVGCGLPYCSEKT